MPSNSPYPVSLPAGYATAIAVGFSDQSGQLKLVDDSAPLPVINVAAAQAVPAANDGQVTGSVVTGAFQPAPSIPVVLSLSGTWTGTVQLLRSADGGGTKEPVTIAGQPWARFAGNACEPVWVEEEKNVLLYLDIAVDSGALIYRMSQ